MIIKYFYNQIIVEPMHLMREASRDSVVTPVWNIVPGADSLDLPKR